MGKTTTTSATLATHMTLLRNDMESDRTTTPAAHYTLLLPMGPSPEAPQETLQAGLCQAVKQKLGRVGQRGDEETILAV